MSVGLPVFAGASARVGLAGVGVIRHASARASPKVAADLRALKGAPSAVHRRDRSTLRFSRAACHQQTDHMLQPHRRPAGADMPSSVHARCQQRRGRLSHRRGLSPPIFRRQKVARTTSSNFFPSGRIPPHWMKPCAKATSFPVVMERSCNVNCASPWVSGCQSSQLRRYAAALSYFIGGRTSYDEHVPCLINCPAKKFTASARERRFGVLPSFGERLPPPFARPRFSRGEDARPPILA